MKFGLGRTHHEEEVPAQHNAYGQMDQRLLQVALANEEAHTHVSAHLDAAKRKGDTSVAHARAGHMLDKVGVAASLLQSLKLGEGCSVATATVWLL